MLPHSAIAEECIDGNTFSPAVDYDITYGCPHVEQVACNAVACASQQKHIHYTCVRQIKRTRRASQHSWSTGLMWQTGCFTAFLPPGRVS